MHIAKPRHGVWLLSAAVLGAALMGVAGCSNTEGSASGHAPGYKDTPPPPTEVPANNTTGSGSSNSSNPMPPGGLAAPPAQDKQAIHDSSNAAP